MGIPAHRDDGTLPPSRDMSEARPDINTMSPYVVPAHEFAERFAFSPGRTRLLHGFCDLRRRLREVGIVQGFHWIGGSFLRIDREPSDIDIVTFHVAPPAWADEEVRRAVMSTETDVFECGRSKKVYGCDARMVEIAHFASFARWTLYWSTLFSTEKASFARDKAAPRRVGFIQVPLLAPADDEPLRDALAAAEAKLARP